MKRCLFSGAFEYWYQIKYHKGDNETQWKVHTDSEKCTQKFKNVDFSVQCGGPAWIIGTHGPDPIQMHYDWEDWKEIETTTRLQAIMKKTGAIINDNTDVKTEVDYGSSDVDYSIPYDFYFDSSYLNQMKPYRSIEVGSVVGYGKDPTIVNPNDIKRGEEYETIINFDDQSEMTRWEVTSIQMNHRDIGAEYWDVEQIGSTHQMKLHIDGLDNDGKPLVIHNLTINFRYNHVL